MKKRMYRAVDVKRVDWERLSATAAGQRVVVGVDVAKERPFAAVRVEGGEVVLLWKWRQPWENTQVVEKLSGLGASSVEVVMEPSGTYGDALRSQLEGAGIEVFRVSPKRCHDYAEVYDGVPSHHDGKSAVLLADLHVQGKSKRWPVASAEDRERAATLAAWGLYFGTFQRCVNRLEAQLARYWPEVTELLALDSATLLELLMAYGDPRQVAASAAGARRRMRQVGGGFLSSAKIEVVLASAGETIGMEMVAGERRWLKELVREVRRLQKELYRVKRRIRRQVAEDPSTRQISEVVGESTALGLRVSAGDPRDYPSAASYLKGLGLNLKVRSSGKFKGQLRLSKRGPGLARQLLYMAVLRWIQKDRIARQWYERKVARDGGLRRKALTAMMRKLARGLWHVGRGEVFDSRRLFDVRRLGLSAG
jgi:transposase